MKRGTKLLLAASGLSAAGYAVYRGRKPREANSIWNLYAPVYNLFMRMDRAVYEEMCRRIRPAAGFVTGRPGGQAASAQVSAAAGRH